jgi:exonuclease SbcD
VDRTEDLDRSLARIAGYLKEYEVDVMLVAGDLFSDYCRGHDRISATVRQIREHFAPFLANGGVMLAISGNHDDENLFETLRLALDLVAPAAASVRGASPGGRPYLFSRPPGEPLRLADRRGQIVEFVPLPYPSIRYLPRDCRITSKDELNRARYERFRAVLAHVCRKLDERLPSVLVSHIAIRGVPVRHERTLKDYEDVLFAPEDLSGRWSYTAYGHIHAPGKVNGLDHVRYAGSIERLDAGERDDHKSVVLVELEPGAPCRVTELPLDATPIHRLVIAEPETDIPRLAEEIAERERALVYYALHYRPDRDNREDLCRRIQDLFPRWYGRDLIPGGADGAPAGGAFEATALADVRGTVLGFLDGRLNSDDPDRPSLLALADELLTEMEAAR